VEVLPGQPQLQLHDAARPPATVGRPVSCVGPSVTMGQVGGGEELSMALGERAEARAPDLLLTVEDQHDVDARAKAQPVQQPEGR